MIPSGQGEFVLLDAGANHECKPVHLMQFAIMGSIYSRGLLGRKNPRIGILSNGTEESKGTELTREAARLCRQARLAGPSRDWLEWEVPAAAACRDWHWEVVQR